MQRRVLVYGGCGALGKQVVKTFSANRWSTISVDLMSNPESKYNIVLDHSALWTQHVNVLFLFELMQLANAVFC